MIFGGNATFYPATFYPTTFYPTTFYPATFYPWDLPVIWRRVKCRFIQKNATFYPAIILSATFYPTAATFYPTIFWAFLPETYVVVYNIVLGFRTSPKYLIHNHLQLIVNFWVNDITYSYTDDESLE
jgi:hypothetical protein